MAKVPQRRVDVRDADVAVPQERQALAAVRLEHAVADEAKGVAGQHGSLPEPLAERHRRRGAAPVRARRAVLEAVMTFAGMRADLCGSSRRWRYGAFAHIRPHRQSTRRLLDGRWCRSILLDRARSPRHREK